MRSLLSVVHVIGFVLWLGGALSAMALSIAARDEDPQVRAGIYRVLARLHGWIIGPGALVTLVTGLALVMVFVTGGMGARLGVPSMSAMMGAGLLGGLLALFIGMPTAQKMGRLATPDERGQLPQTFERLRRRLALVSSVAGVLGLVALYFGVIGA